MKYGASRDPIRSRNTDIIFYFCYCSGLDSTHWEHQTTWRPGSK